MKCILHVKGRENTRYDNQTGRPKNDVDLTIDEAIKKNSFFWYKQVYDHVLFCHECAPVKIIEKYYDIRMGVEKFNGKTSVSFARNVLRYEMLIKRNQYSSQDITIFNKIINSSIVNAGSAGLIFKNEKRFSLKELMTFVHDNYNVNFLNWIVSSKLKKSENLFRIYQIHEEKSLDFSELELGDLIVVMEVHGV